MGNLRKFLLENQMVRTIPFGKLHEQKTWAVISGAPNENIVQNHLNMALLNVFYYLNGRYKYIFSPENFSSVRIS